MADSEFVKQFQDMIDSIADELEMMYTLQEMMRNYNVDTVAELPAPGDDEYEELDELDRDDIDIIREFAENYGYTDSDCVVCDFVNDALDITYETELSSGEITSVTLTLTTGGPHIELTIQGDKGVIEGWWGDTHLTKGVYSYNYVGYDICEQIFDYVKEITVCK